MSEKQAAAVGEQCISGDKTVVLIAVDGSEHSYYAFDWYLKNVHKPDSEVLVAFCSDFRDHIMWAPVMSTDPSAISTIIVHCEEEANGIETQIKTKLASNKVDGRVLRLSGDPGPAIIKAANEHKVSLIVTGSRGHGKVRRTLLGSVSSFIVHHARCPVMICRKSE